MNSLSIDKYQKLALLTKAESKDLYEDCCHAGCGLVTEVGEIVDTFKRHWFYKKPLDTKNLREEIGDVLWYLAIGYYSLGVSMEEYTSEDKTPEPSVNRILAKLSNYANHVFVSSQLNPETWQDNYIKHDLDQLYLFLRMLSDNLGFNLEEVAYDNIQKLSKRYPKGSFSEFDALNRNKENELSHIQDSGEILNAETGNGTSGL